MKCTVYANTIELIDHFMKMQKNLFVWNVLPEPDNVKQLGETMERCVGPSCGLEAKVSVRCT